MKSRRLSNFIGPIFFPVRALCVLRGELLRDLPRLSRVFYVTVRLFQNRLRAELTALSRFHVEAEPVATTLAFETHPIGKEVSLLGTRGQLEWTAQMLAARHMPLFDL